MYLRERVVKFHELLLYIYAFFSVKILLEKTAFCSAYLLLAQTHSPYPSEKTGRMYQNYAGFIPKNGATYSLLNFCSQDPLHNDSCEMDVCTFTL